MIVDLLRGELDDHATPLLAVAVFQDEEALPPAVARFDEALGGTIRRARSSGDLTGRTEDALVFYLREEGGPERLLVLGAGRAEKYDIERVRRVVGRAVREAEKLGVTKLTVAPEIRGEDGPAAVARAAAEAATLAAWRFRELKTGAGEEQDEPEPTQVESVRVAVDGDPDALEEAVRVGAAFGRAENLTRRLQALPGNRMTPSILAADATAMAEEVGLGVEVLGPDELLAERCHAILAVSRGSTEEPRLIVLRHEGGASGEAPLVLVGKGLTFDAGGISLKPSKGMEEMKYDMSGGAAVIGAMRAVAELDLPLNVVGVVPSSENLPSGSALKPGDVIDTRAGKTVEVVNTDAEGRLILSDALAWATDLDPRPAAIVDCATLTGAVVVGLGHHAAGVLGTDDELVEEVREAGERTGERCWPLPLWDEYRRQLDSDVADIVNVGGRPAGTITAAAFLREFVGDVPWAHLDIAGTAYGEGKLPYQRKGGTGWPTRLLAEWVRSRAG